MKRFTETTKWSDPWFRKLPPASKLLWQWMCDQCDAAGIIDLDLDLASFMIGGELTENDLAMFGDRIRKLPNGKFLIVKFIGFQYGQISASCPAHKPVFRALSGNGLDTEGKDENTLSHRVSHRVSDTLQDKDKDKDKDQGVGVQGKGTEPDGRSDAPTPAPPPPNEQTDLPIDPATKKRKDRGTIEELREYAVEIGLPASDGDFMFEHWSFNGWKNGKEPVRDWKAGIRKWKLGGWLPSQKAQQSFGFGKRPDPNRLPNGECTEEAHLRGF